MPRQPRLDIPHTLHHVIVRGIEKRDIFVDDDDRERFVARLSSLLTESSMRCFAWSLMSNHLHLLLMPTKVSLSELMRRLLTGYAVYFNRKYRRSGHLFQNRYKSILCEEEPYFLELVRYIHLNPLRAGLVADLTALDRYPWCGHAVLLGYRTMKSQETNEVLARFSRNKARSRRAYHEFVVDGIAAGRRDELVGGGLKRSHLAREGSIELEAYDERILGSGEFVESMTREISAHGQTRKPLSLSELLRKVCEVTSVDADAIRRPCKERSLAEARAIFCCLAVREFGYTGKEAGVETGLGSAGVSIAARRGEAVLKKYPLVREKILEIATNER